MEVNSRWKLAWAERPWEEASNFNPMFCAELIGRAVGDYWKSCKSPLNFAISFLVLPLILHEATRDALPRRSDVAFGSWVVDKNLLLADFPDRVNRLRPITREAILFAIQHELLAIQDGGLVVGDMPISPSGTLSRTTDDVTDARNAARLLGRWFANQKTQSSILQGMGVTP